LDHVALSLGRVAHSLDRPRFRSTPVVARPHGSTRKTTFAREYLPQEAECPIFINADLIAEGLSPFAPELVAIRS
jgi:predicted ABC-type ATPase